MFACPCLLRPTACRTDLGYYTVTPGTSGGTLYVRDNIGSVMPLSGTFTVDAATGVPSSVVLNAIYAGNCAVTYSVGAERAGNDIASVSYSGYTGGSGCAPDACMTAGFNFAVDGSTVAFLSKDSSSNDCTAYIGEVTTPGTIDVLLAAYMGGLSSASGIDATYTDTTLSVTTTTGCGYTFNRDAETGAAGPRAGAAFAVAAAALAGLALLA